MEVTKYKCLLVKETQFPYEKPASNSDEAYEIAKALGIQNEGQEVALMITLNVKCKVIGVHEVSRGGLDGSIIDPREIFKRAILNNAAGIILVHNHPSGDLTPSRGDIQTTHRLQDCGDLLGIKFLDHIIVTDSDYTSMAKAGLLEKEQEEKQ